MSSPQIAPFIQPIGYLLTAIVSITLTYLLTRRSERYKAEVGYHTRQREIRYSKMHDKRLEALEGMNFRMVDIIDLCLALASPMQSVPLREGSDLKKDADHHRQTQIEAISQKINEMNQVHRAKYLYIPVNLNEEIVKHNNQLARTISRYAFWANLEDLPPKERLDHWNELEAGVLGAKETRNKIEAMFRALIEEVER